MVSATITLAAALLAGEPSMAQPRLPPKLAAVIPAHRVVLAKARVQPASGRTYYVVAIGSPDEHVHGQKAGPRPLLIYEQTADGRFVLSARNDQVVYRADEGGQCDPFEDGRIAVKGSYFTVENGVGCGNQHWTDYVTFRFDPRRQRFVFDNERFKSLKFNPDQRPDAEALIPEADRLDRPSRRNAPSFADWRRR